MMLSPIRGKYVIAVSGGVDSIVLLNLLVKQSKNTDLKIIVAHFDHGIRKDSLNDLRFVKDLTTNYGLKFYSKQGFLGSTASEQKARQARYSFLNEVVKKEQADGLITAHHQDDLIETAIINIIRGTGRKGLSSLSSEAKLLRPLLDYPKSRIIKYAQKNNLQWQEDPTNLDTQYLRNYIRHNIMPKLDKNSRTHLVNLIKKQAELNYQIDKQLTNILNLKSEQKELSRIWLNSLDYMLSKEVLAVWLRQNGITNFDRYTIERLSSQLKTVSNNKKVDVLGGWQVILTRNNLALEHSERYQN